MASFNKIKKTLLYFLRRHKFIILCIASIFVLVQLYRQIKPHGHMIYGGKGHNSHGHPGIHNPTKGTHKHQDLKGTFNKEINTKNSKWTHSNTDNNKGLIKLPNEKDTSSYGYNHVVKGGLQHTGYINNGVRGIKMESSLRIRKEAVNSESESESLDGAGVSGMLSYEGITFYPPDCRKKLLVFVCRSDTNCGGLADRQKGIMATFVWALLTNRTFVIDTMLPCNIEQVLPPNLYDWTLCRETIKKYPSSTRLVDGFNDAWKLKLMTKHFTGRDPWTEMVVKWRINKKLQKMMKLYPAVVKVLPWLLRKPEEDLIKHTMEILFKPSVEMSSYLDSFNDVHFKNRYIVCAHLRVGLGMDATFLTPDDIREVLGYLARYLDNLETPHALYIASDSSEAKRMAKTSFPNAVTLNVPVEHLDQTDDISCKTTFISVLEQTILSQCDTLLLTGSGYSRLAVLIGGKAQHIVSCKQYDTEKGFVHHNLHSLAEAFGLG